MLGYHVPIPKSSITPQPAPFRIPLLMDSCFSMLQKNYLYIRQAPILTIEFTKFHPCFNKKIHFSPHPQQKNKRFEQQLRAVENNFNNLAHHLPVAWPTSASRKASSFDAGLGFPVLLQVSSGNKNPREKVIVFRWFLLGVPRKFSGFLRVFKTKKCSEMIDDDYRQAE